MITTSPAIIFNPVLDNVKQAYKETLFGNPDTVNLIRQQIGGFIDTNITSAQMLTLNTVPVVLVPAAGAGLQIIVDQVFASLVYNSTTYAVNASGASLLYKSDGSGQNLGITLTQGFLQSASGTNFQFVRGGATAITDVTANLANQPVVLKAASADPTTGNSPMIVRTYFWIIPAPLQGSVNP